ncbi:hypothetical protein IAG25_35570 [Caballeronia sp. EK]|uniref:hypothetical protein n=1 Tax=Caballeronia sp. EK TaxID=2767469 RepID=UPI0016555ADF|nr:hypothetical protein [Caballeronia sp. EK]MBC8642127.1 hypothetical protein [Caballeronia sp. EK]
MATTYQMQPIPGRAGGKVGPGDAKGLKCAVFTYALAGALVINDMLQSPMFDEGTTIVDVTVVTPDLDSSGSPAVTLDVGYGVDPDYFIAASTVGQAGGVARASAATALPLTLTADDTIDIVVKAAPATSATSGTISLAVYFLPPNA